MHTTVYLIRNAETPWNEERRLAGRRELGLSAKGEATARSLVEHFEGVELDEMLASPLPRTVETAGPLAAQRGLEVARDPRLSDWNPGQWEGRSYADIAADPHYATIVDQPIERVTLPGGDRFADVLARMLASIDQALQDNELGAGIAIVSHAGPLRILLSHYLSVPPWEHARLRLEPGSITVLRFSSLTAPPTLLALNVTGRLLDTLATSR